MNIPVNSTDENIKIYVPNTNKKNTENISESDEVKIYTIKKWLFSKSSYNSKNYKEYYIH